MKCMRRTLIVAGVLCFGASTLPGAASPLIRSLHISGVNALPLEAVEGAILSRAGAPWNGRTLEEDFARIRERYRQEGYWHASAGLQGLRFSGDSTAVDVEVAVEEGTPTRVADIRFEGLTAFGAEEALGSFEVREGDPLRQESLERDLAWLLQRLEERGYPFAEARVADATLRAGGDSVDLAIEVRQGGSLTIDEVRIEGARETDPAYILRETRIRRGEPYSPERLEAVRDRLSRLNIFASVAEPELYVREGKGGVAIRVQEGSTNTFDGVAGYVPATSSGDEGYVTGLVSLSMRNLFGTGRKLAFRWEKLDQKTQELGVRYTEPWLFGLPVGLGGGFEQRRQDTAFVRRAADLRLDFLVTDRLTAGLVGSTESVIPSADTTIRRSYRSSALTLGVDIAYDSRDDAVSPTGGVRYRADYHYGTKALPIEGRVSVQRVLIWSST
jgi:outer membrane protein assembly factor BamA